MAKEIFNNNPVIEELRNERGQLTYRMYKDNYWTKWEYDEYGRIIKFETKDGFLQKFQYTKPKEKVNQDALKLIDANRIEYIFNHACETGLFKNHPQQKKGAEILLQLINGLESLDAESLRPQGVWHECGIVNNEKIYRCSACDYKYPVHDDTQYCQHCGTKLHIEN